MTVTTTLTPHVIDALITKFEGMTVSGLTDAQGNTLPLTVYDGYPGESYEDSFIVVGGAPTPTARVRQHFASLGQGPPGIAPAKDEEGEIVCYAQSATGSISDPNPSSTVDQSQKIARDNAYAIVAAVETSIRTDTQLLGLGGAAAGVPLLGTGWCDVLTGDLHQTSMQTDPALGAVAVVEFNIHWFTRLRSI